MRKCGSSVLGSYMAFVHVVFLPRSRYRLSCAMGGRDTVLSGSPFPRSEFHAYDTKRGLVNGQRNTSEHIAILHGMRSCVSGSIADPVVRMCIAAMRCLHDALERHATEPTTLARCARREAREDAVCCLPGSAETVSEAQYEDEVWTSCRRASVMRCVSECMTPGEQGQLVRLHLRTRF